METLDIHQIDEVLEIEALDFIKRREINKKWRRDTWLLYDNIRTKSMDAVSPFAKWMPANSNNNEDILVVGTDSPKDCQNYLKFFSVSKSNVDMKEIVKIPYDSRPYKISFNEKFPQILAVLTEDGRVDALKFENNECNSVLNIKSQSRDGNWICFNPVISHLILISTGSLIEVCDVTKSQPNSMWKKTTDMNAKSLWWSNLEQSNFGAIIENKVVIFDIRTDGRKPAHIFNHDPSPNTIDFGRQEDALLVGGKWWSIIDLK